MNKAAEWHPILLGITAILFNAAAVNSWLPVITGLTTSFYITAKGIKILRKDKSDKHHLKDYPPKRHKK